MKDNEAREQIKEIKKIIPMIFKCPTCKIMTYAVNDYRLITDNKKKKIEEVTTCLKCFKVFIYETTAKYREVK